MDNRPESLESRLAAAEARIGSLEALNGILYRRLADRAESLPNILPGVYRREEIPEPRIRDEAPVDLVLTVRDTYDFLVPCLESVLRNTDIPFRLFLNDNASEDPRTPAYLREVRERLPGRVRLFLQSGNLGFPDAVNLMLRETENDVVLINADTVLPPGWTSRLLWPIRHSGERIAASAPFTTASAMGAFPHARVDNELLPGMDVVAMDGIFRMVKPSTRWEMPFAPGFCMALSRRALDEAGLFDAETFRPGYGEEADWCLRASKLGYRHVLAANVFVYHKHGVTFKREPSAARDRLLAEHVAVLNRRHPGFEDRQHDFNDNPEFLALCSFLLFLAGSESGGGLAVRFVGLDELRRAGGDVSEPLLLAARDAETGEYFLRFLYREFRAAFTSPNLNWAIKAMYRVKVNAIRIDEFPPGDEERTRRAAIRMGRRFGVAPLGKDGDVIHEA